jgi:hypothetical protein
MHVTNIHGILERGTTNLDFVARTIVERGQRQNTGARVRRYVAESRRRSVPGLSAICCIATNGPWSAGLSFRPSQYRSLHRIGAIRVLETAMMI